MSRNATRKHTRVRRLLLVVGIVLTGLCFVCMLSVTLIGFVIWRAFETGRIEIDPAAVQQAVYQGVVLTLTKGERQQRLEVIEVLVMADVKKLLGDLETNLGGRYGVSLNCTVDLYDRNTELQREQALRLLTTGLSTSDDNEVYRTWGDSTPHRYVVDGEIRVVPHDQCPKCWGEWDFKWTHQSCRHCDTALGENCKILLDSDICPHCEQGNVSAQTPRCERCGFEIDPSCVVWG